MDDADIVVTGLALIAGGTLFVAYWQRVRHLRPSQRGQDRRARYYGTSYAVINLLYTVYRLVEAIIERLLRR